MVKNRLFMAGLVGWVVLNSGLQALGRVDPPMPSDLHDPKAQAPRCVYTWTALKPAANPATPYLNGTIVPQGIQLKGQNLSQLELLVNGKPTVKLVGSNFVFDPDRPYLDVREVAVTIHIAPGVDLEHPAMDAHFENGKFVLTMLPRSTRANTPFFSNYHRCYLMARKVEFAGDTVRLYPAVDGKNTPLYVQSEDYFSKREFNQFNLDVVGIPNVLTAIFRYNEAFPSSPIQPDAALAYLMSGNKAAIALSREGYWKALRSMAQAGFINFNADTTAITYTQRLQRWSMAAQHRRLWDTLGIPLEVSSSHIVFHLGKPEAILRGVQAFPLNDHVTLIPKDSTMVLKANRGLDFQGILVAGNMEIRDSIRRFSFDYVTKSIAVGKACLNFARKPGHKGEELSPRNLVIENVRGRLNLGHYCNYNLDQQGVVPSSLQVADSSLMYWDRKEVRGGIYTRDSLSFALYPFRFSKLEDVRSAQFMKLKGRLFTGGILPLFVAQLQEHVQNGYSTVGIGLSGIDTLAYQGAGRIRGNVALTEEGLIANGQYQIGASTIAGKQLLLTYTGVTIDTAYYQLKATGAVIDPDKPEIEVPSARVAWDRKTDEITVRNNTGAPIALFGKEKGKSFDGKLVIRSAGVFGTGKLTVHNLEAYGDTIKIGHDSATGHIAKLVVRNIAGDSVAVARDGNLYLNGNSGDCRFDARKKDHYNVLFSRLGIKTSLERLSYNKNDELIDVFPDHGVGMLESFRSGVQFLTARVQLRVESGELGCYNVDTVAIADALVMPVDKEVHYDAKGVMQPLDAANVAIMAHRLHKASVQISNKNAYQASGTIQYAVAPGNLAPISMEVQTQNGKSIGTGEVGEAQRFHLSPMTLFTGKVHLVATNPALRFDGIVHLETRDTKLNSLAIQIDLQARSDSLYIPIGKVLAAGTGLILHEGSGKIFPAFLRSQMVNERLLVPAGEFMTDQNGLLKVGTVDALKASKQTGTITFEDATRTIRFEGLCDFPMPNDWAKAIQIQSQGIWLQDLSTDKTQADLRLQITVPEVTHLNWGILAKYIQLNENEPLVPTPFDGKDFPRAIILEHVQMRWTVSAWIVHANVDLLGIGGERIGQTATLMLKYAHCDEARGGAYLSLLMDLGWDNSTGLAASKLFFRLDKQGKLFTSDYIPFIAAFPTRNSVWDHFDAPLQELETFEKGFQQRYPKIH